jgi:hypothetical protein
VDVVAAVVLRVQQVRVARVRQRAAKSITPSNTVEVRIQALTARRFCSATAFQYSKPSAGMSVPA